MVWSFRWNTEISLQSQPAIYDRTIIDHHAQHFYKVEHRVYMTGDEIFEVISNYEPRFIAKKK